jgi:condensin complex subunit 1
MLTTCCYKLLENPAINRNKAVRDIVFNIIGIMVKKYNHALSKLQGFGL